MKCAGEASSGRHAHGIGDARDDARAIGTWEVFLVLIGRPIWTQHATRPFASRAHEYPDRADTVVATPVGPVAVTKASAKSSRPSVQVMAVPEARTRTPAV